jgi:hypothetical protein
MRGPAPKGTLARSRFGLRQTRCRTVRLWRGMHAAVPSVSLPVKSCPEIDFPGWGRFNEFANLRGKNRFLR